jgi:hypothetical protein
MSKGDAENTFSTSYQGPNMPKLTRVRENPIFQKFKRDRDEIAEAMSKKMIDSLQRVYRPAGAPEPMVPKEARKIFEIDMEDKRRNRIREDRKKRRRLNEEIITAEVLITPEERNLIRKERKNLIIERRKKYILAGKTSISRLEGDEEPVSSMKDVRKSNANYRTLRQKKERQSKFYNYLEERGYDTSELLKSVRSGKTY